MALQVVKLDGDDYARGCAYGDATAEPLGRVLAMQQEMDSCREAARAYLPFIADHAPRTLDEMHGCADGAGVTFEDILAMVAGYERFMLSMAESPEKCTAFAAMGDATVDGNLICGQNNDEGVDSWLDGAADVLLLHIEPEGMQTLIYTHVGLPAYMGMNTSGLCVMWMTINNRDNGPGVPSVVLLRELMRHTSLDDAVDYLRRTPRACPNNFMMAHATDGISSVECSYQHWREVHSRTALCHANHILDEELGESCAMRGLSWHTTFARQARMDQLVNDHRGRIDVAAGCRMLRNRDDEHMSIRSTPGDKHGWATLASMVFHPAAGQMFVAEGWEADATFERYTFMPQPAGAEKGGKSLSP